jgi:uncharacterized protein YdeI (YjbR/CyaY-like superfamily)
VKPTFFATPADFRRWLSKNHRSAEELWVGFHKKGTGRLSITWPESVDEALCVGWIDGIRKSVNADSYMIRFTPRRRGSIWSNVNIKRAGDLIAGKRMKPAGVAAFEARTPEKSGVYLFEQRESPELGADAKAAFKANAKAWKFFTGQPPGYQRLATWWVVSAKREETKSRRLATLIGDSAAGRRIGPLRRPGE